jgi:hypothetical protein
MTNEQHASSADDEMRPQAADANDGITVTMNDTLGTIFLGLVAMSLLIALLHAQARIRELQTHR